MSWSKLSWSLRDKSERKWEQGARGRLVRTPTLLPTLRPLELTLALKLRPSLLQLIPLTRTHLSSPVVSTEGEGLEPPSPFGRQFSRLVQ